MVESEKAEAKYENGLLKIFAPIKDWEHKVNVMIQIGGAKFLITRAF